MTDQELLYTMALTMALRQQSKHQRTLLEAAGSATAVYEERHEVGKMFEHFSPRMAEAVSSMESLLPRCEQELAYARDHHIQILSWQDDTAYPARLRQCEDAPLILYFLGKGNLNAEHVVSIVGTRRCTERGRDLCDQLARTIAKQVPGTLIISGLAYGIDVAAHRGALAHGLPTVGVLAHGMDEIYPRTHRQTAVEMLQQGGLVTEFMSATPIDRLNFLQRNRIVAGLADAIVVVESPVRGGSLNTARLGMDYQRDVFTFPGRPTDATSEGCNLLIRNNGATLINSPMDLLTDLGWSSKKCNAETPQKRLFPDLTVEEQAIVDALVTAEETGETPTLTYLADVTGQLAFKVTSTILALEMKGLVKTLPGNRYHLINA